MGACVYVTIVSMLFLRSRQTACESRENCRGDLAKFGQCRKIQSGGRVSWISSRRCSGPPRQTSKFGIESRAGGEHVARVGVGRVAVDQDRTSTLTVDEATRRRICKFATKTGNTSNKPMGCFSPRSFQNFKRCSSTEKPNAAIPFLSSKMAAPIGPAPSSYAPSVNSREKRVGRSQEPWTKMVQERPQLA